MASTPQHVSPLDRYTPAPVPPPLPLSDHPIVAQVMMGKRYVTYPFVASIVVLTFRRTMGGVRVIESGDWPMGPLFGAALVSFLFGWWGFPWGLIWTPLILFQLWRGGRDHTREVLTGAVGAAEAKRIMSIAPKPKLPGAIWIVRLLVLFPVLLFGLLFISIVLNDGSR